MTRSAGSWVAEVAWLVVSTTLLAVAAVRDSSGLRWVWLVVLVVNVVIVGGRTRRLHRQAGRPPVAPV